MNVSSRAYAGTITSRITSSASRRSAAWSAAAIVVGICANGV
jgi:hypothetical protein